MARSTAPLLVLAALLFPLASVAAPQAADEEPAAEETAAQGFTPPQIILGTQTQPVFPPAAWDARYEGSVLLEMTVLQDGTVGAVKVVECTHRKVGFEEAATEAVKSWRFEPGMEDGQAIEVATRLRLNFTRVGVGLQAKPQVSAGSFTVATAADLGGAPASSGGDSK